MKMKQFQIAHQEEVESIKRAYLNKIEDLKAQWNLDGKVQYQGSLKNT